MRSKELLIFVISVGLCNCRIVPNNAVNKVSEDTSYLDVDTEFSSVENEINEMSLSSRFENEEDVDTADLDKAEKYQGDIILSQEQQNELFTGSRTGLIDEKYRWPKNSRGFVLVPYTFSGKAGYTHKEKVEIRNAMKVIERHTCIRFPLRKHEKDYVQIYSAGGCYSSLGRQGNGQQAISLMKNGCLSRGTIQHEIIHALGYDHMQNHPDRDRYVTIVWSNIMPSTRLNFEKGSPGQFSNFDTPYDYKSVMHYNPFAFAVTKTEPTIITKDPAYKDKIGQRKGMSIADVRRINRMYDCKNVVYL